MSGLFGVCGGLVGIVHRPSVGPRNDPFVQTGGSVSGTQVQTTAACSLWQKGRVEQPSRNQRTKRLCNTKRRVSVVSYEVANEGQRRTDETRRGRSPSERGGRERLAGNTFHHPGISARGHGKTCRLRRDPKNHYLGPPPLSGPHVRGFWFGGRAYLCAAEHLRRVAPDEGNLLGMDESRKVDELPNYGDPTSWHKWKETSKSRPATWISAWTQGASCAFLRGKSSGS